MYIVLKIFLLQYANDAAGYSASGVSSLFGIWVASPSEVVNSRVDYHSAPYDVVDTG